MSEHVVSVLSLVIPIIIAVIAAVPGMKSLRHQREVRIAEADKLRHEITQSVLAQAQKGIATCAMELEETKKELEEALAENRRLKELIEGLTKE